MCAGTRNAFQVGYNLTGSGISILLFVKGELKMNTMHDLQHQVQTALMDVQAMRDSNIDVLDSNGVITLRGTVPTVQVREQAEAIVRQVPGVTTVINELDVI